MKCYLRWARVEIARGGGHVGFQFGFDASVKGKVLFQPSQGRLKWSPSSHSRTVARLGLDRPTNFTFPVSGPSSLQSP